MGADDDLDVAVFDFGEAGVEGFGFFVVGIEAGNLDLGEEFLQLGLEEFGAETLVEDAGVVAVGAGGREFFGKTTGVTEEGIGVRVKGKREKTSRAESLPATMLAEGEGGGATTIVIDEGLVTGSEVFVDGGKKSVGEVTRFFEGVARSKVDDLYLWRMGGGLGFFVEGDERVFGLGEIKIGNERGRRPEETSDF